MELVKYLLEDVGAITLIYLVGWPLFEALMFALGYTFLHCIVSDYKKAIREPFKFLLFLLIKLPTGAFYSCKNISSIKIKNIRWEPWFKYTKVRHD